MAMTAFTDSAGRTAYKDSSGNVYTEGGNRATGYNEAGWNARQSEKYGGSTPSSTGADTGEYSDYLKKISDSMTKAIQPAVESYKKAAEETTARYAQKTSQLQAEIDPLKDRYENLKNTILGREQKLTGEAQNIQAEELAKRGILPSSTLYSQQLQKATSPIASEYTGYLKDTELQGASDLRNLLNMISSVSTEETGAQRDILNAIATLQANAGTQATTQAQSAYESAKARKEAADARAQSQANWEKEFKLKEQEAARLAAEAAKIYTPGGGSSSTTNYSAPQWEAIPGKNYTSIDDTDFITTTEKNYTPIPKNYSPVPPSLSTSGNMGVGSATPSGGNALGNVWNNLKKILGIG